MKKEIRSAGLSEPVGVFSQATCVETAEGTWVYVSGLTARNRDGSVAAVGDVSGQTETILENMEALLAEVGGSLDDILKVTVYIVDMNHFAAIHEVRRRYFRPPYPASTMVQVSRLVHPDSLIEIDAVALVPRQGRGASERQMTRPV